MQDENKDKKGEISKGKLPLLINVSRPMAQSPAERGEPHENSTESQPVSHLNNYQSLVGDATAAPFNHQEEPGFKPVVSAAKIKVEPYHNAHGSLTKSMT